MHTQLVVKSSNAKVGPIPISNSSRETCPPSCPFIKNGCYADAGFHTRLNWDKLTSGERGTPWDIFLNGINRLKDGQLWRHNVSGDLVGKNDVIDEQSLSELVNANAGKRGFTYTHYPMNAGNKRAVIKANKSGFTINASANSLTHARKLAKTKGLPVVCVLPMEYQRKTKGKVFTESLQEYNARLEKLDTDNLVVCPATSRDDVNCSTCKLCSVSTRKTIVGFPAHGTGAKKAEIIAKS